MSGLLGLLLMSSVGWANDLNVAVHKSGRYLDIEYETKQNQSSMCELVGHRVTMDSTVTVLADDRVTDGVLEMDVDVPSGAACLTAIGKHSGMMTFKLGKRYPELKLGVYELWINAEYYGELNIRKFSVNLTP